MLCVYSLLKQMIGQMIYMMTIVVVGACSVGTAPLTSAGYRHLMTELQMVVVVVLLVLLVCMAAVAMIQDTQQTATLHTHNTEMLASLLHDHHMQRSTRTTTTCLKGTYNYHWRATTCTLILFASSLACLAVYIHASSALHWYWCTSIHRCM
jgi:hypothetical protein